MIGEKARWARVRALGLVVAALDRVGMGLDAATQATARSTSPALWALGDALDGAAQVTDRAAARVHRGWTRAGLAWEQGLPAAEQLVLFAGLAAAQQTSKAQMTGRES